MSAGYASAEYARSLAEFGAPRHLTKCDGWLLQRTIDGTDHRDGMGPYPLFCCHDWRAVAEDLDDLASDLVSVVLVADPLAGVDLGALRRVFDRVVRFKDHHVAELDRRPEEFVNRSHRAHARRALRSVTVDVVDDPPSRLEVWERLFANLADRHSITGIRAFSHDAFEAQLRVPGLVMFEAAAGGDVIGLDLWYVHRDVAYGHLAAFSEKGYALRASYATKWTMLQHFFGKVRVVDLMGSAGLRVQDDGLARFKAGWATGTMPAYLCGRVLQPAVYAELVHCRGADDADYFPAYRLGEFA